MMVLPTLSVGRNFVMLDWSWMIGAGSLAVAGLASLDRFRLSRHVARLRDRHELLGDEIWEVRDAVEARQKAEAASEAKSRFLATVSHEVRTPLNGILGIAELLAGTPLDREQMAYVEAVKSSGQALATLIDEILDFSRIEAGKLELADEIFDLAALIEGIVELLAPRAQDKGLEIATLLAPDLPTSVRGDPIRLRQVLTNLAGNAIKFTARGGVGLVVEPTPDGRIRFAVNDTGPGVRPDRREAIFEEFEQADGTTTRQHGGTGLGLAISRRIVDLMGGALTLADREGGGSIFGFEVVLPAATPVRRQAWPDLEGHRILVAAASPFQAPFLASHLAAAGASVKLIGRPDHALAEIKGSDVPTMLFVDCALGEAAAERLADAARAAGVKRSFLLFSPFERRAFGQKLVSGYEGWLVKPVRSTSLALRLTGSPPVHLTRRSPDTATRSLKAGTSATSHASRAPRVLLAEDNEINTLVAMNFLGRLGAQVVHASDGQSALSLALAALVGDIPAFDVILMDVSMPVIDGIEATRQLRQAEALGDHPATRIVALTAHAFREDHDRCLRAGMDAVVTKPLEFARLESIIRRQPGLRAVS